MKVSSAAGASCCASMMSLIFTSAVCMIVLLAASGANAQHFPAMDNCYPITTTGYNMTLSWSVRNDSITFLVRVYSRWRFLLIVYFYFSNKLLVIPLLTFAFAKFIWVFITTSQAVGVRGYVSFGFGNNSDTTTCAGCPMYGGRGGKQILQLLKQIP